MPLLLVHFFCRLQKPFLLIFFLPHLVVFLRVFCCVFLVSFTPSLFFSVFFFIQSASLSCCCWVCLRGCYYSRICCCFFAFIQQFQGFLFVFFFTPFAAAPEIVCPETSRFSWCGGASGCYLPWRIGGPSPPSALKYCSSQLVPQTKKVPENLPLCFLFLEEICYL